MIAVDTDVLVIHHLFVWDKRREVNEKFLSTVRTLSTTVHNLLELCGITAKVTSEDKAIDILRSYLASNHWTIIFPRLPNSWEEYVDKIIKYLVKGMSFGDSLIAWTIDECEEVEAFITWNIRGFKGKIKVPVYTPREYLTLH